MGEKHSLSSMYKVEPRYNEGPRDWQNLFAKMRLSYRGSFPCIIFYYYWSNEYRSLYRELRYNEAC